MAKEKEATKRGVSRRSFVAGAGAAAAGVVVGAVGGSQLLPMQVIQQTVYTCPFEGQEFTTEAALADHIKTVHASMITKTVEVVAPPQYVSMTVNGVPYQLELGVDVKPWHLLADTLRERLGLLGTKISCDMGACGRCTVLVDGNPTLSCSTLTMDCDGKKITTIEGLQSLTGKLHPVQQAFIDVSGAIQCGYCTPAAILATKALLDRIPNPSDSDVVNALSGVICRCGGYKFIKDAVALAVTYSKGQ